jgi:hypothetical protein
MLTPTKEKTWLGLTNYSINSGVLLTDAQATAFKIIDYLISIGWTCVMSSNHTSYGAARYINSAADWVYGYSNAVGSWIVLQNPGGLGPTTAQLLLYSYDAVAQCSDCCRFSPGGLYTGGNTTTLPTATDEIAIKTTGDSTVQSIGGTAAQKYLNILYSSDFACTRIFVCQGGYCAFYMMIEKLKSPPANTATADNWHIWYAPSGCGTVADKPTIAYMWSSSAYGFGRYSATPLTLAHWHTGPSLNGGHLGNLVTAPMPEQSVAGTTWPAWPIGIAAYNISGSPSFVYEDRGQLYDIAWGCASQVTGSTYDSAGSKSWVKMGSIWIPWDGSTPMIA